MNLEDAKMGRIIILTVAAMALFCQPDCLAAAVSNTSDGNEARSEGPETKKPRPRVESVTMVDFYMRDGNTVSGKLLSEDSTQVVVEQVVDKTITTKTYSKREIDTRTLRTRPIPESQYYTRLAEYFTAQTWDFRDDPDEFIQAIRCYERAKQSLGQSGAEPERITEIDKAIRKVQDDRDVWTREVESRVKLKKLEFDAEAENRLKKLERDVADSITRVNESIKYLDKTAADMKGDYERIEKAIAGLNKDFVKQINDLQARLRDDEVVINDLSYRMLWLQQLPPAGVK
jgi:hypothetical protein